MNVPMCRVGLRLAIVMALVSRSVWADGAAWSAVRPHPPGASRQDCFVENRGQWGEGAKFLARLNGALARLESRGFALGLRAAGDGAAVVRVSFAGAESPRITGEEARPGRHHFLLGDDAARWHRDVPAWTSVRYGDVYPGIDARFHLRDGRLEYDLEVAPGARVDRVLMQCEGVSSVAVDESGALVAQTPIGSFRQQPPVAYQCAPGGERRPVPCSFRLVADRRFGFDVGDHDPSLPLMIDPELEFSTYLGGSLLDDARAVAVGADGSIYVTGYTESADFPTTAGAYDLSANGAADVFIAKLDPSGSSLVQATYLGGSGIDWGFGIAVDGSGAAYVTGQTGSTNFPTSLFGYGGGNDAFLAKLNPAGDGLVYATYLGGSSQDTGLDVAIDASGAAYVGGQTDSANFPTTAGAFDRTRNASQDGFVTKVDPAGTALVYSTYLGGTLVDSVEAIAVDSAGSAYLTGQTASTDFPFLNGFDGIPFGAESFVTKLNAAGSGLVYSTYLGGGGIDAGYGIAVNGAGEAYVVGSTSSPDFPATAGAFDTSINGGADAFVTRISAGGNSVLASTFLGGSSDDVATDVAVTSSGSVVLTGWTSPAGFPTTADAYDTAYDGSLEAFLSKLGADLARLDYSTLLGGSGTDLAFGLTLDRTNAAIVVGSTSGSFPTTAQAYDRFFNGTIDAFVSKFDFGCDDTPTVLYRFTGDATQDALGAAVSGAGDVNGDGYDDVLVAVPTTQVTTPATVRVYSGLNGTIIRTLSGSLPADDFGCSVHGAGDVDGDGFADAVVGAVGDDVAGPDYGAARVFSGRTGNELYAVHGSSTGSYFGRWVSGGGDVNRDGTPDLIVGAFFGGASGEGQAFVYSGRNGALLYQFTGLAAGDGFGWPVANAGDVNADGYADIAVGAIYGGGANHPGTATVFSGRNGSTLYTFTGSTPNEVFGFSLAGAGDVNRDGFDDVIAGTYGANHAWIYSGANGSLLYDLTPPSGGSGAEQFGYSVDGAGDVNDDGYADVVVGAPWEYVTDTACGTVRTYSGKDGQLLFTVAGSYADLLGWSVAGAGDVNRDGYADVITGSPYEDSAAYDAGMVSIYSCHRRLASWSSYGFGWPGTSGVPGLTPSADPILCTTIDLQIGNSRGVNTTAFLFVGLTQSFTPTIYDGTLLVLPALIVPIPVAAAGLRLPASIPCDSNLSGTAAYLQVLEIDPGASKGVSFSSGLVLSLGS